MTGWVDVTDLVQFARGGDPASGVQRVVCEIGPLLEDARPVIVDPDTGRWLQLGEIHRKTLLEHGFRHASPLSTQDLAVAAAECLASMPNLQPAPMAAGDALILLGSAWIDQGVLLAIQRAAAKGVHLVAFIHDLTPIQEAGHSTQVQLAFRRYLATLADHAGLVLANSHATLRDFESFCRAEGRIPPHGVVTGLPPGITPDQAISPNPAWPRPYVLFVGTLEARKEHRIALQAWQDLATHIADLPDLVCVGRWGWGSQEFRFAWEAVGPDASRVYVLDQGVSDAELASLYRDCLACIYPSRLEGWGMPVTESLAFGKVVITSNVSSMPEAGGGLAVLIEPSDATSLSRAVRENVLDERHRRRQEDQILASDVYRSPRTWRQVAELVNACIGQAEAMHTRPVAPRLDLGREYILGTPAPANDPTAIRLEAVSTDRGSPLLGQPMDSAGVVISDALITGDFAQPTAWGYPVGAGGSLDVRFRRTTADELLVMLSTAPVVGSGSLDVSLNETATRRTPIAYGEVISVVVPAGSPDDTVEIHLQVVAQDKEDGLPVAFQSCVVLSAQDVQARITILERIAKARSVQHAEAAQQIEGLRAQLDGVLTSTSWRFTAPLRKVIGDGN